MLNIEPAQNNISGSGSDTQQDQDNGNPVWEEISPLIWRDAIYSDAEKESPMGKLFAEQTKLYQGLLEDIKKDYEKVALVEVGMGTAELFSKVVDDYDMLVGVEISQQMIDFAYQIHDNLREHKDKKVKLQLGNACELNQVLTDSVYPADAEFWQSKTARLTCMCMNTFGILPDFIRKECIKEMLLCAGPGGKMVIGCWHKDSLRTGFEKFYSKHPELCGVCKESDFDFEQGNFNCSSSDYTSHWWSDDELRTMISEVFPGKPEDLNIRFEIIGIGIFAICEIAKDANLIR